MANSYLSPEKSVRGSKGKKKNIAPSDISGTSYKVVQIGGRRSREKGNRREREFAHLTGGRRVPLSGSCDGFKGDVQAMGLTWQCKALANGWRTLYAYLDGADALAVKADRREWLVVIPLTRFLEVASA